MLQTTRTGGTEHPEEMLNFLDARSILTSGVVNIPGGSFEVTESDAPDLGVKIALGYAYLAKDDNSMVYPVRNFSLAESVSIATNASGNPRIDAVVLYIDLNETANADSTNVAKLIAIQGTPAVSPSAPTDGDIESEIGAANPYIRLANVDVDSGAVSILDADITDKRNESGVYFRKIADDGWLIANDVFTYVDVDEITCLNDKTAVFTKGTKFKCINDGSTKQFYVKDNAAYSSGTNLTTILLAGEDDLANDLIESPEISYSDCPKGFKKGEDWYNFEAYLSTANQSIPDNVLTRVDLNGVAFDPNNNFETSPTFGWTCPVSGKYSFLYNAQFTSNGAGGVRSMFLYVNGVLTKYLQLVTATTTSADVINGGALLQLNKGDLVKAVVYQNSGSALDLRSDRARTYLSGNFVGL